MGVQPTGTVTFLFTDIEGSTRLWDEHPVVMPEVLGRHDAIVRAAIGAHGGFVFSTGGDGVGAAFQRAGEAVAAAVDSQRVLQAESWPAGVSLRVRMGVHTGEAQERDGDYFGPPLNRAARLMGAARGGQVAVSGTTVEVIGQPVGWEFVDLGGHRFKGLVEPVHVFAVRADGLAWVDRPLARSQETPGNLPLLATEFIGRVADLRRRVEELPKRRLVTLTGTGGVGKTRAAMEIGWMLTDEFSGGVWFVELAPIADPDMVAVSLAAVLSIELQQGVSILESIVDWLRARRVLLILDNCEHVLAPVADLVTAIVSGCPTVTVLATSREPLGVAGERVHAVSSLDPATDGVELFCHRALAADGSFDPSDAERMSIVAICSRLDGIPLGIELAAARTRSITVDDLLVRLDDRFRLLRGSGRGGHARHQTLRATVMWSYQLLRDEERFLFDRLSVFAGGFDVAAAEGVCAGGTIPEVDVLDLLASLVDKSMLVADRTPGVSRYRFLETLREYGEERLLERGDTAAQRDCHLRWYVEVAAQANKLWGSAAQLDGDAMFDREWANIRAAHSWAVATTDLTAADALVAATAQHAFIKRNWEHGEWAERTLTLATADCAAHPTTYGWACFWAFAAGDQSRAIDLAYRGINVAAAPDHPDTVYCWAFLPLAYLALGRASEARESARHLRVACPASTDPVASARAFSSLMEVAVGSDLVLVEDDLAEYTALAERVGAPSMLATANQYRGQISLAQDPPDIQGALDFYRSAFDLAREIFDLNIQGRSLLGLMIATTLLHGVDGDASHCSNVTDLHRGALIWFHDARSPIQLGQAIDVVAWWFAMNGNDEAAAVVYAHLDAHHPPFDFVAVQRMRRDGLRIVRALPGADKWMARGAAMDAEEVFAFTLAHLPEQPPARVVLQ